ncbi:hypothetical protein [Colwellia sp. PAMC 20917]|uniref:IS66 family transposase n=1 Tax=Colwellia sp. PAMC 20917 TaxID=1816218 RepID=UPI001E5455C7|nr:hypothetical protein [Colwellia sp. PAMC 20917]
MEQFRHAKQQSFGVSCDGHPAQGDLFTEVETDLDVTEEVSEFAPVIAKKKPVSKKLPSYLPREVIANNIERKPAYAIAAIDTWVMIVVKILSLFQHE